METTEKTFTIGQLAAETGLTRRALRLYEQASLLTPLRDANNYRYYTEQHLKEASVIRDLRISGMSIERIQQIFAIKYAEGTPEQKLQDFLDVLDIANSELMVKRQAIDEALKQLEAHRQEAISMLTQEEKHD
jgi:MerR family copper efflux transcriptional regulator